DVAPAAELYFRTGFYTAGDFAKGIQELKDAGCDIITDDVTYITEPFLKDGVVAKTVNAVKDQGVTYFSAAGNFANRSYENNFNPKQISSGVLAGKTAHDFGGGDIFQKLRLAPGNYTFVFQWVDDIYSLSETGGTKNDLDIYLTKNEDGTGLIGYNRDNLNGDPIEFIPITIPGTGTDSVDYNILIINNTPNATNPRIKYIVFRGNVRFMESFAGQGASTLVGQANATGAIAVGASRYNYVPDYINNPPTGYPVDVPNNPSIPSSNITKPKIESFSSTGGTLTNGESQPRNKPDLVGPDGGNTTVKLGQDYPDWSLDGYSNFFGTSAAAPHVAG
ncbi:MAG: S8 family serine peptidase, partial [Bacteroidia bacterium]|nr:S8 family serine peptidase [Bacteroidia bacterium]